MKRRRDEVDVVYVERDGGSSAKSLVWGMVLGAALALLYAPRSGEETRRSLQRKLRKLRAMAEEKVDEIGERFSRRGSDGQGLLTEEDADFDDDIDVGESPREDLERRLSDARARRRGAVEDEEPLA